MISSKFPNDNYHVSMPALSDPGFILGGFLVGLGTKLGNGCTSGHGICGLARFSKRSLVAVCTFMATGILTASTLPTTNQLLYHESGTYELFHPNDSTKQVTLAVNTALAVTALYLLQKKPAKTKKVPPQDIKKKDEGCSSNGSNGSTKKGPVAAIVGSMFALGLEISGMTKPHKIVGFLDVKGISDGTWDWTLVCVMGGGLVVSALGYQMVKGYNLFEHKFTRSCPLSAAGDTKRGGFNIPTNKNVDAPLIIGSGLFGVGWAVGRLCPAPALCLAAAGCSQVITGWWPGYLCGVYLGDIAKGYL
mmetsp:Transcript_1631/g.1953  ORF Transcript_1631/g.1953 Transcript_1631/m.1953 type:complete len:305 (+) Transcript_1631:330-1244(+)|eukprot:CAMPEP_0204614438 /NCGR_PEP_ID=MMETSP0717-20131115/2157_1 /ASSEMBLY_ACC=CAM_ASM_000666 /TAXON_ID=230516 /ORGANISM="Chaetoceros curvisetus" /LENGTH=304 /DNA_ID=CAMNT_0051627103 /DNA_START=353 /DNA_END=1267 /DNA_ORIENTATION=-